MNINTNTVHIQLKRDCSKPELSLNSFYRSNNQRTWFVRSPNNSELKSLSKFYLNSTPTLLFTPFYNSYLNERIRVFGTWRVLDKGYFCLRNMIPWDKFRHTYHMRLCHTYLLIILESNITSIEFRNHKYY